MASQILPVWCPVKVKLSDGREVDCNTRGLKSHGGLCKRHRAEAAAALKEARVSGADLVGLAEIAERAGVTKNAVQKWRSRHPGFPAPAAELAATPVWKWHDVERWLQETGRLDGLLGEAQ